MRRFVVNREQGSKQMMTYGQFQDRMAKLGVSSSTRIAYIDVEGFELKRVKTEVRGDGATVIKLK